MVSKRFKSPTILVLTPVILLLTLALACGGTAAEPVVIEKEVVKEVIKEVPVEKVVIKEVVKEVVVKSGAPTPAPIATVEPAVHTQDGPSGVFNYGYRGLPPFNVFPTITEGAAYHHNGFTTAETLVFMNREKEIIPRLFKDWSVSPDGVTWTFKIQEGVQFHKGYGELDAEGVFWSMQVMGGKSSRMAYNAHIRRIWGIGGDIHEGKEMTDVIDEGRTKILDKYTIEVNTVTPQYDTLHFMAFVHVNIGSKKQIEDVGVESASKNIAATSSWEFMEHKGDQFTRWRAVEDHWRKTPEFAEMVWQHIPEESTRIANFQTGLLTTMQMNLDSIPAVEGMDGVTLMRIPGGTAVSLSFFGNYYVGHGTPEHKERVPGYDPSLPWISGDPDPASDEWKTAAKVRTALSIAIDRELLVETLLAGEAVADPLPAYGYHLDKLPPEYRQWEFNPDKSKELLAEAGYPDGFKITMTPITGFAYPEVTAAIAQMWEVIGIKTTQQNMPYATFRPGIVTRTYNQAYQHTNVASDPLDRWAIAFNSESGWNFGVDHPVLRDLMKEAQGTVEPVARYKIMAEAAAFMYDNALSVGLYAQNLVLPLNGTESWYEHINFAETRQATSFEWAPNLNK